MSQVSPQAPELMGYDAQPVAMASGEVLAPGCGSAPSRRGGGAMPHHRRGEQRAIRSAHATNCRRPLCVRCLHMSHVPVPRARALLVQEFLKKASHLTYTPKIRVGFSGDFRCHPPPPSPSLSRPARNLAPSLIPYSSQVTSETGGWGMRCSLLSPLDIVVQNLLGYVIRV